MSRFNSYMACHFSNCRLIARARDVNRQRDVKLHAIPGHWDVVGVSDGVDAWIAPVAAGPFFKTSTGDCAKLLKMLEAGEPLPAVPGEIRRPRAALLDDPTQVIARRSQPATAPITNPAAQRNTRRAIIA